MKYAIILAMCAIGFTHSQTQTIVDLTAFNGTFENNTYYKDISGEFDNYLGEWEYTNGNSYLKIKIFVKPEEIVIKNPPSQNILSDYMACHIYYSENGNVIYNTEINNVSTPPMKGGMMTFNDNNAQFMYEEPSISSCEKGWRADINVELLNSTTLVWKRKNLRMKTNGNTCPDGTPIDFIPFRIPDNLTLTKI